MLGYDMIGYSVVEYIVEWLKTECVEETDVVVYSLWLVFSKISNQMISNYYNNNYNFTVRNVTSLVINASPVTEQIITFINYLLLRRLKS